MWILWAVVAAPLATAGDRAALARAARGDERALAEIYDRHARLVYSLALRIVRDAGEAEDVVQEVFAQLWQQASRYDAARANVAGWLVMLTRSRAIDRLRRRQSRPDAPVADPIEMPDTDPLPDDRMVAAARAAAVRSALDDLPVLQRVAIELAFYEGLTHVEIAAQLDQPLGTVKTRIRQGLRALRDRLAQAT
jgi:RNA polymerase sigma-70 factor (ECF subfamily)